MRSNVARTRIGLIAGGVVIALAVVLASGGGHATTGARAATAQDPSPPPTGTLPDCGTPAGTGIKSANPIVDNKGVANVLAELTQALPQVRDKGSLASLTAIVVYGQDVVYAQSFGCADIGTAAPMTPETIVEAASVSKMMTAIMLMQLRDAGRLNLQDSVNSYLPGAEYLSPSGQMVSPTFLELASHSSGLPRDMLPLPTSKEDMLTRLHTTTAVSEPGTAYLYSNLGFALLGQVLATVAGVPFEQYVEANILGPLSMRSSYYPTALPAVPEAGYATPYVSLNITAEGVEPDVSGWQGLGVYNPAAGLYTTAMDMAQVLKLVFSGGNAVLSESSLQEMQQQVISALPELEGIGIGWEIYVPAPDMSFTGKDGALSGFQEQLVFAPGSNAGVFVVANTADATDPTVPELMLATGEQMLVSLVPVLQAAEK